MSCCCSKILNLCKASICQPDTIVTGIAAPGDGEYQLVLGYLGNDIVVRKEFLTGQPLNFSAQDLNEKYTYTGRIVGPGANPLTITVDEIEYDCISFETVLTYETAIPTP